MSTVISLREFHRMDNDCYQPASDGSREIARSWAKEKNYLRRSAAEWWPTIEAALRSIGNECRRANWDGEGAVPVTNGAIELAARISAALFPLLPIGTPVPDLIPEADGEICISWTLDAGRVFAVSIGEHGKMNFAGQFGSEGGVHAWQPIDATDSSALEASLDDVVRYVRRLHDTSPVRRAA